MRPRGPLPRRTYWVRRALLGLVAVALLACVWWLVPGGGTDAQTADLSAATTPRVPTTSIPPSGSSGPTHPSKTTAPPTTTAPHTTAPDTQPPSAPTGSCSPTVVRLALAADSAPPGRGTTVRYRMWTTDGSTCRLGITPTLMETKIYSATDLAWQSAMCPDEMAAKNVVVRPAPALLYSFHWDGLMRTDACSASAKAAPPAQYRVTASLIGGEPQASYFFVTEPNLATR